MNLPLPAALPEPVRRRLLTADEFQLMGEAGVIAPGERVELIEGEIVQMAPIGMEHSGRTNALTNIFAMATAGRAWLSVQNPLRIDEDTEVYPDFCLLRLPASLYDTRLPQPGDVLLLVEVVQSSLRYDRGIKLPLYARAGVPEVWLVEVEAARVVRYAEPSDGSYLRSEVLRGQAAPLALPECGIRIESLFPASP